MVQLLKKTSKLINTWLSWRIY